MNDQVEDDPTTPRRIWPWGCCEEDAPCSVHTSLSERTIYFSDPLRAQLEAIAEKKGSTLKAVVAEVLRKYVARPPRRRGKKAPVALEVEGASTSDRTGHTGGMAA